MRERIENIYEHLTQIMDISFVWYSYELQKIVRYGKSSTPQIICEIETRDIVSILDSFEKADGYSVLYYENNYKLRYMYMATFEGEICKGILGVGPYVTHQIDQGILQEVLNRSELDQEERKAIYEFYQTLAHINSDKECALTNIIIALLQTQRLQSYPLHLKESSSLVDIKLHYMIEDIMFNEGRIKRNYELEEKIVHFIRVGDKESLTNMIVSQEVPKVERLTDMPLRGFKNLLIVFNTIARRTLAECKVDKYMIHVISERFAIEIEKSSNKSELQQVQLEMIKAYCDTSKYYQQKKYSELVGKAVSYIEMHFNQELTLKGIAEILYIHPNYLSQKFKKETGMNISEYINERRIEEAKYLLDTNLDLSSNDIGYSVGYNDKKYFAKLFKQKVGVSPNQYRREQKS